jgi:uncharacterized BrkB/YihY/UPF0761 family membrane protein
VARSRHGSVDALFDVVDRDVEVGGGILAGALAYRLFIWLLPLALVLVAGLGIAADAASQSPKHAAGSLGLAGIVSTSVAGAAESPSRWYALLVGAVVLLVATRSVLRAVIGAHRLVWVDVQAARPRPTPAATLKFLALLLAYFVVAGAARSVREWSPGLGLVAVLAAAVVYTALWLLVSVALPHRDAGWTDLLPGAVLFGLGIELVNVLATYLLGPYALNKQGTYGALGLAAALLVGLFLIGRLVVAAAELNATLWERRQAPSSGS